MENIMTLVWGLVRTNGEKFYLLDDEPVKMKKIGAWQPEGTVCWKVTDSSKYSLVNTDEGKTVPLYNASLLVFGKDACVELLDNPQTEILVSYYSSEDKELEGLPV